MKYLIFIMVVAVLAAFIGGIGVLAVDCAGTDCKPPCECVDEIVCRCKIF